MTSFLLLIFTLSFAPMVNADVFDEQALLSTSLENAPTFHALAVTNSELKHQTKTNYIAFEFVPIVLLAETNPHLVLHSYYLPIYQLKQEKEYFLLI